MALIVSLGPLVHLKGFNAHMIKWCTMHTVNLGILFALNGGCLFPGIWFQNQVANCQFHVVHGFHQSILTNELAK